MSKNLKPIQSKGRGRTDPYKALSKALDQINKSDLGKSKKNRRMKQAIQGMRDVAKTRANTISAVGTALAKNFAPTAAAYAYGKATNDQNSVISGANQLVAGGKTTKNNSTDIDVDQYGDRRE